ncbi:MAG: 30S ribosomal protein S20 [Spirochaeta sp.]|nr:30S ribosomal protein S20 [Spirochaeta sp.]RPG06664.1 MAG: 30S ribosomal protein S20 [Proteobacteria bacterium TMED72]
MAPGGVLSGARHPYGSRVQEINALANHKSALKRIRQSERRRKRNQHARSGMRTQVKRFMQTLEDGDAEAAQTQFRLTERSVRRAASNGLIPKKRADRQLGRLARRLNALSQ